MPKQWDFRTRARHAKGVAEDNPRKSTYRGEYPCSDAVSFTPSSALGKLVKIKSYKHMRHVNNFLVRGVE